MLYFLFIVLFIVYAGPCIEAAREAISLFLFSVFPSLLPFFIVSKLMLDSAFPEKAAQYLSPVMEPVFGISGAGAAALLPGILCGYPVGAAACAGLYGRGLLQKAEAERLSAFCNNAGPFFVAGAVGAAMGRSPGAGLVLLATHISAGLVTGFIMRLLTLRKGDYSRGYRLVEIKKSHDNNSNTARKYRGNKAAVVAEAVRDVLTVGGFIVIFAVIIAIIRQTRLPELAGRLLLGPRYRIGEGMICGIIEMTTGCGILTKASSSIIEVMPYLAFLLGFGGLSVHAQVISILSSAKLRALPFIRGKILHGLLGALLTAAVTAIPPVKNYIVHSSQASQPAFNTFSEIINEFVGNSVILNIIIMLAAAVLIRLAFRYIRCCWGKT